MMRRGHAGNDARMGATVFEETWPIAQVAQPAISGTGNSYALSAAGEWLPANTDIGPTPLGGTVGAKLIGVNTSGRTLNANVTVEITLPDGSVQRKDNPSGALANGASRAVELKIPASLAGTYMGHFYFELWV
jgi:hypothetical protein